MGGGDSSTSEKTTETVTTTTTTINDIGLTGAQAVDMAAVLESGGIRREEIAAATLEKLVQGVGSSYQQLIGGASDLVTTAGQVSGSLLEAGKAGAAQVQAGAQGVVAAAERAATGQSQPVDPQIILYLAVAAGAIFLVIRSK
jgi:hypothetical protein